MNDGKPQDIDEYKKWLKEQHSETVDKLVENRYRSVTLSIISNMEASGFWGDLPGELERVDQEYYSENEYHLFNEESHKKVALGTKPFDSFLLKTYRKNVLENTKWPNQPDGGWILPSNWFSKINDIIRTLLVVKYLDGVNFLVARLGSLLDKQALPHAVDFEARAEGYYAAHLYTRYACEVPGEKWDTERIWVVLEIQITTQLQEVIRKLLHRYYEERRKRLKDDEVKWQWKYDSDEFAANYLGHILHYVEGMIMDVRYRQKERTKNE